MTQRELQARIQEIVQGGGGGGARPAARKQSGQGFLSFFLVLNLFYSLQIGSNILFQGSRGCPTNSRGIKFFPGAGGGSKYYFP